jgi:hypothetical protein
MPVVDYVTLYGHCWGGSGVATVISGREGKYAAMSEVNDALLKARRWRMLADLADRDLLIGVLIWLVSIAMIHFVADRVFGMFETLGATFKGTL